MYDYDNLSMLGFEWIYLNKGGCRWQGLRTTLTGDGVYCISSLWWGNSRLSGRFNLLSGFCPGLCSTHLELLSALCCSNSPFICCLHSIAVIKVPTKRDCCDEHDFSPVTAVYTLSGATRFRRPCWMTTPGPYSGTMEWNNWKLEKLERKHV